MVYGCRKNRASGSCRFEMTALAKVIFVGDRFCLPCCSSCCSKVLVVSECARTLPVDAVCDPDRILHCVSCKATMKTTRANYRYFLYMKIADSDETVAETSISGRNAEKIIGIDANTLIRSIWDGQLAYSCVKSALDASLVGSWFVFSFRTSDQQSSLKSLSDFHGSKRLVGTSMNPANPAFHTVMDTLENQHSDGKENALSFASDESFLLSSWNSPLRSTQLVALSHQSHPSGSASILFPSLDNPSLTDEDILMACSAESEQTVIERSQSFSSSWAGPLSSSTFMQKFWSPMSGANTPESSKKVSHCLQSVNPVWTSTPQLSSRTASQVTPLTPGIVSPFQSKKQCEDLSSGSLRKSTEEPVISSDIFQFLDSDI